MKYNSIGIALLFACAVDSRADPRCGGGSASHMSTHEIREAILSCSPVEQVEMYLASIWRTHPPSFDVARVIAHNGEHLLPVVLGKMRALVGSDDEAQIEDLMVLIGEMQGAGVRTVPPALDQIAAILGSMTDEDARSSAMAEFDSIVERARVVDPSTEAR